MPTMLEAVVDEVARSVEHTLDAQRAPFHAREVGSVVSLGKGIAHVRGLPNVKAQELVRFANGSLGLALNLEPDDVGVVVLDSREGLEAGSAVSRTMRVIDVPVGPALLGRVIDGTGEPLDERGPINTVQRRPIERDAPAIMDRAPVAKPLQTGIKVIDALVPIGRGQRQLIVGDRQTGKTGVALAAMINQRGSDVICIYCAIGQRGAAVSRVIDTLRKNAVLGNSVVMVASGDAPAGLQYITAYSAMAVAEYFMALGRDVLLVYDDLTRHAQAYRELSLLLRRPPGREAYPGDIFYIHSRLLERATRLKPALGGGSITALPIVEIQAQNLAAYIPTNLISITDGQLVLSTQLFQKGVLPAVDVGQSVSRVGGKAQLPAYLAVAAPLRLAYAQFQELEIFARFATRLDAESSRSIARGRRVREMLRQGELELLDAGSQVCGLLALNHGLFDHVPIEKMKSAAQLLHRAAASRLAPTYQQIAGGETLTDTDRAQALDVARETLADYTGTAVALTC